MNYNQFIAPSYDGRDPAFSQQARFLRPPLSTNGPGSENAQVAPRPTNSRNKCYNGNYNYNGYYNYHQNTHNTNQRGSSGQNWSSGRRNRRRNGNRSSSDSCDYLSSHPDGASGPRREPGVYPANPAGSLLPRCPRQGSSLNFAKVRPTLRSPHQENQRFDDPLEAGRGRRSRGRQRQRNQHHRQSPQFDDQVAFGYYGGRGRGPPEQDMQPRSCTYGPNGSNVFGPFGPHTHPTPPDISFVYRDFDGDIDMPEAPPLEPDPWLWHNSQRLIT